jgi:ligand-binding SRPBCC domain-containing protein
VKIYHCTFEQNLPIPLTETWDFFTSPLNLAKITPQQMRFKVTSAFNNAKIYPGMIITYKVSPLFGIKLNWMTEITHVKDQEYFVDEQRFGPYAFWHHEHHFTPIKGGVKMTDILYYAIGYGIVGRLGNRILVGKQIKKIFKHREQTIIELFGKYSTR